MITIHVYYASVYTRTIDAAIKGCPSGSIEWPASTSLEAQSSNAPSGSPISTPSRTSSKWLDTAPKRNCTAVEPAGTKTCDLLPDTRLIAPSLDGPNVVPNELSNSVKCWA